jgi:hypothetical protein
MTKRRAKPEHVAQWVIVLITKTKGNLLRNYVTGFTHYHTNIIYAERFSTREGATSFARRFKWDQATETGVEICTVNEEETRSKLQNQ